MNLLPHASGMRPRLACEISPQGVVAARSDAPGAALAAVAKVSLVAGAVAPGLKLGNIADRVAVIAALRKVLEDLGQRPNSRGADLTLVIPDAAVRVLLLDFDALPNKLSEALPIVRFRLKKLLPFDADDAMISYQMMSTSKAMVRVLAVAMPRDVLAEYETVAREAGFEPGAVLPSTVAAIAAMDEADSAALIVNATEAGVTTAIVRSGIILLHRSVDLQPAGDMGVPANLPAALFEDASGHALPLVDVHDTASEWAAQEAAPEHGRNPYADRARDEAAVQNEDGVTSLDAPREYLPTMYASQSQTEIQGEPAPVSASPYAGPTVSADLNAELHNAILIAPTSIGTFTEDLVREAGLPASLVSGEPATADAEYEPPVHFLEPAARTSAEDEIAEAVNVAAAYFEDTLSEPATQVFAAGPMGAERLQKILAQAGVAAADGLRVRELVVPDALLPSAVSASVPRGWLAGVTGALKS